MLLMTRLLRTFRVASVLTAFRLAIVVPVGLGVLLWNEPLGWAAFNFWAWAWRWWPFC